MHFVYHWAMFALDQEKNWPNQSLKMFNSSNSTWHIKRSTLSPLYFKVLCCLFSWVEEGCLPVANVLASSSTFCADFRFHSEKDLRLSAHTHECLNLCSRNWKPIQIRIYTHACICCFPFQPDCVPQVKRAPNSLTCNKLKLPAGRGNTHQKEWIDWEVLRADFGNHHTTQHATDDFFIRSAGWFVQECENGFYDICYRVLQTKEKHFQDHILQITVCVFFKKLCLLYISLQKARRRADCCCIGKFFKIRVWFVLVQDTKKTQSNN